MIDENLISEVEIENIYFRLTEEIHAAWQLAENDPDPDPSDLLNFVHRGE